MVPVANYSFDVKRPPSKRSAGRPAPGSAERTEHSFHSKRSSDIALQLAVLIYPVGAVRKRKPCFVSPCIDAFSSQLLERDDIAVDIEVQHESLARGDLFENVPRVACKLGFSYA